VKDGRYYEIPASETTRGHATSGDARYWKQLVPDVMNGVAAQGQ